MVVRSRAQERLDELRRKREQSQLGGGQRRIDAQHGKGKLTARERIAMLMDEGAFEEIDRFVVHQSSEFGLAEQQYLGDSVVTGYGKIDGRLTFVYAQDFTVMGGSLSQVAAQKICKVMDQAVATGAPMVGLIDSGGARIQEGVDSLAGYSDIFLRNVRGLRCHTPDIGCLRPGGWGRQLLPALTDYVMMVKGQGQLYITGPDVIRAVTGEEITHEALGGSESHASKSGVAHFDIDSEIACISSISLLLSFLPQNNMEEPPRTKADPADADTELDEIVPDSPSQSYNILDVIRRVVDDRGFMEVHASYAKNIVVGHARIGGRSVGIVANQPEVMAGVLDINASVKAARFVRFCDAFNIPLVTFIDVPGFMPGSSQEYGGIIRHGAKLIFAYAEATVPKISVLTRKAYGGAYIVMSSKNLRGDVNYSWPTGEVAVMGAEGAVNIIHRNEIRSAPDPDALRSQRVAEYQERFMNPYVAAGRGMIDDVIQPSETRAKIIGALEMLENKREVLPPKKHGSIPL